MPSSSPGGSGGFPTGAQPARAAAPTVRRKSRRLEIFGAPDIDARAILGEMRAFAPQWLAGCQLREIWFEPTLHKHAGQLCKGIQIHVEGPAYDHAAFRPWRLQALAFKAIRRIYPDYALWRDFAYEYEHDRLAIDLINGSSLLREWLDNVKSGSNQRDAMAMPDETAWHTTRRNFLLC